MKLDIEIRMDLLEDILVFTQSWQSAYLGEHFVRDAEPSSIGDLILISTRPLSNRERCILFGTLSRLIDEYLIADQSTEAWPDTAIRLGCAEDVQCVQGTLNIAKRFERVGSHSTLFKMRAISHGHAARSAAHLIFAQVLSQNIGLLDCDRDSCRRRFIFGTKRRTRFHAGDCGRRHHNKLVRRRNRDLHIRNSYWIEIAIDTITAHLESLKGDWRIATLTNWSKAEGRVESKDFKCRSRRQLSRVPRTRGCKLLRAFIDVASNETNLSLIEKLIERCWYDSAESKEYIKSRIEILSLLIKKVERIRTDPEGVMMDLSTKVKGRLNS